MMRRPLMVLLLAALFVGGCRFAVWEKEVRVMPEPAAASTLSMAAAQMPDDTWLKFLDLNRLVDSVTSVLKNTAAREAIRRGTPYIERKRFFVFDN